MLGKFDWFGILRPGTWAKEFRFGALRPAVEGGGKLGAFFWISGRLGVFSPGI